MQPEQLEQAMRLAAAEARRWMGATHPNPPVGAVALNTKGEVLAAAAHQHAGSAHAEALLIQACRAQGMLDRVDTLVVTLEPCNHHGHTPPCVDAILAAGIRNVCVGVRDPNPRVKGGGLGRLRDTGVNIVEGIAEQECRQLFHAFAYHVQTGKPWLTVKRAFDAQGSMIPPQGQKTFTSPDSLKLAHLIRKKAAAILTGSGTILADNPLFTVRHVADFPGQRRWLGILDRRRRVPESYLEAAAERGFDAVIYDEIPQALADLAAKGAIDIMAEAGPSLSQSLLDSGLWTMSVTVRQSENGQENVEAAFNPQQALPFDPKQFRWDAFLPQA